jgi:alcohol dehydrogenase
MLCEYGMGVWRSAKSVLIGADITAQECDTLLLASTLAGMAITHTGTSLPHGLSYYLTYEKGIPHGKAVGYFLPGYLAEAGPLVRKKVLELTGFPDIQYFAAFIHKLLGEMDAEEALIQKAVSGLLANETKLRNTPYPVDENVLQRICQMAY